MGPTELVVVVAIALAVVVFIVWPLLRGRGVRPARAPAPRNAEATGAANGVGEPDVGPAASGIDIDRVERRIQEYRAALRRQTVCPRCLYANPAASRFCAQCGARLAAADAAPSAAASSR